MRKRVQIQQNQSATKTTKGQKVPNWVTVATVWAQLRPVNGREVAIASQVKAIVTHALIMRWPGSSVSIDPTMRAVIGSRIFNLTQCLNADERNRRIDALVLEQVKPAPQ
jgi:SPP1 family predicted phage head-tail adaptor